MKKIKKINTINTILALTLLATLTLPVSVLAYQSPQEPGGGTTDVDSLVSNIVSKVWIVFAAIAVILFIWAGVLFLVAQGQPEKVSTARMAALWGVVGVVVMVLAFSIFNIATSLIR